MSHFQYHALSAPLVPRPPTDAVATDAWQPVYPDRAARLGRPGLIAACAMAIAAPLFVADVTQPAPALSWRAPMQPAQHLYRPYAPIRYLVSASTVAPIATPTSTPGGSVIPTGSYQLWQYQAIAGPLILPPDAPLVLNWQPVAPSQIAGRVAVRGSQAWAMDRFDPPTPPTVPDYGWNPILRTNPIPRSPTQIGAQAFANDTQWTAPVFPVSQLPWRPTLPGPVRAKASIEYTQWAQPHFVVQSPDVPVMSWTGWYLDPPVRARRSVAEGTTRNQPLYLADITVIAPTLSARAIYPDRVSPKAGLRAAAQQTFTVDAQWTAPAAVTAPAIPHPVYLSRMWPRARTAQYPAFVMPAFVLDVTVPVPTLSWKTTYPDRMARRYPTALYTPALSTDAKFILEAPPTEPGLEVSLITWNREPMTFTTFNATTGEVITWNVEPGTFTTWPGSH